MSAIDVLRGLLVGKNQLGAKRLDAYWESVRPEVSWYPSAGACYRDVLFWNWARVAKNLTQGPSIFIHTDYNYKGCAVSKELFQPDKHTRVQILAVHHLGFKDTALRYGINPAYAVFPESALGRPAADLLDIRLTSDALGIVTSSVLYFYWENINFLQEVVLARKLPITHLFKLREGCGLGGATVNRFPWPMVF